jgi:predicted solute-binding protein
VVCGTHKAISGALYRVKEKKVKMNLDDEISAAGAAGKMDNGALLHDDIT